MRIGRLAGMTALLMTGSAAVAATPSYDPRAAFAPLDLPGPINAVRSGSGQPGPSWWQNRADYQIHATLDTAAHALSGEEAISYTNNSPDTLDVLWLQLDQNMYRPHSRSHAADGAVPRRGDGSTDGYTIERVEVEQGGRRVAVPTVESDTRLQIRLPAPLAGKGGKITVHLSYRFVIPGAFGGRMAWGKVKDGAIYDLAQWYPRMAVYDDVRGWDTLPYLAQEFYLDYGDFDYWVTVPADMIVAGSGALQNPQEVLTATERSRLAQAAASDSTVKIVAPAEIGGDRTRAGTGTKTWHYRMENTRDVAFSASDAFAWDAARITLPGGRTSLAMSYYPAESAGAQAWDRSTQYVKDTVETMSKRWYPYPWPAAINIAGPASGMEYPGIVFDGITDKGKPLFWITAHEIGHSWFPMIVGFDERRDAWMDEGFNTFIDTFESEDFHHGEYAPKRDSEFAPGGGNPVDEILPILADPQAPPILSRADTVTETYRHPVTYFKSALGLVLLRDEILGPERFDPAFRRFIALWAFKHPKPSDFFRFMDSEAGEDLSWWWRGWYLTNATYDVAVTKIAATPNGGTAITVENRDPLVMPVTLRVDYADGSHEDIRLPAETWIRQTAGDIAIPAGRHVVAATLDPDHRLPDRDRSNNRIAIGG
ncbi:M1 family metallopeptidase [Sphingomonas abietis]|uniref:M1 family metallopeptidase n=1 Tax=Sphingomonas abietis TaxID=3012344 RepID=A0ABY7NMH8_9SPHN|nr:M1 family metallopeptidase [Sphingomonas abietis]WBO21134.1 M1 family metallopeptidase [Sphingomonas abietis]